MRDPMHLPRRWALAATVILALGTVVAIAAHGGPDPGRDEHAPAPRDQEAPPSRGPFGEPVIVFMDPTPEQEAAWRAGFHREEDFYVAADDRNWYRSEALEYLDEQDYAPVLFLPRGPLEFIVDGATRRYDLQDLPWLDVIVAYRPGAEPLVVPPISIDDLRDYFVPGQNAEPEADPPPNG